MRWRKKYGFYVVGVVGIWDLGFGIWDLGIGAHTIHQPSPKNYGFPITPSRENFLLLYKLESPLSISGHSMNLTD